MCATPAASTFIKCQKIADCGGSAAASLSMSSNERSLYHLKVRRLTKRPSSLRISSDQNFSLGELPFTTAMILVSGNTRRILSKTARKLCGQNSQSGRADARHKGHADTRRIQLLSPDHWNGKPLAKGCRFPAAIGIADQAQHGCFWHIHSRA